jgi:hypothetical protein
MHRHADARRRNSYLTPITQKLGDEGARHDDALVDVEAVRAEPGLVDQVGGGLAGAHARIEERLCGLHLGRGERIVEVCLEVDRRQAQGMQDEPRGLVERVGGPVTVRKARRVERVDAVGEQGFDRRYRSKSSTATR